MTFCYASSWSGSGMPRLLPFASLAATPDVSLMWGMSSAACAGYRRPRLVQPAVIEGRPAAALPPPRLRRPGKWRHVEGFLLVLVRLIYGEMEGTATQMARARAGAIGLRGRGRGGRREVGGGALRERRGGAGDWGRKRMQGLGEWGKGG
jgi:hypothetical protein